jgi:outer membrane protein
MIFFYLYRMQYFHAIMKNTLRATFIAAIMLLSFTFAHAQSKIGFINLQQLVVESPDYKGVKTALDVYQKQFIDQVGAMNTELQTKGKDYESKRATMTDAIRSAKEAELQDIQKRMQDFENTAQQQVDAKANELTKPLIDKARVVISAGAKEKGYLYVLDSSQGTQLLVSGDGDDIMAAVKAKLGYK